MKNKLNKSKLSLFLSVLFLFQIVLFNINITTFAATLPSVTYSVTGDTIVGNTIEIAVNITNVSDLYGGSIDFVYDPTLLEVQSVTKGDIFGNNKLNMPLGSNGKLTSGQASFTIMMEGGKLGVSNNGKLAIIKAKVLKEGTVKLNTTNSSDSLNLNSYTIRVKLGNSNGLPIKYIFTNKEIYISSDKINSYEDFDKLLAYSGSWNNSSDSRHSSSSAKYSSTKNDSITFTFNGTGFKWYGQGSPTKGIANIYIDGVKQTVDTYSESTVFQQLFFEKSGLTNSTHIVKIEVSGNKNSKATNSIIHIDKIDIINGTMISSDTIKSYEDSDKLLAYSGSWSTSYDSRHNSSSAKYSSTKNDSITFTFNGTGFKWYGQGSPTKGIANIYIDGVKQTVDTYSESTVFQQLFFEKSGLTNSTHIVKIEVSGNKNSKATNSIIHIDKIDIINGEII